MGPAMGQAASKPKIFLAQIRAAEKRGRNTTALAVAPAEIGPATHRIVVIKCIAFAKQKQRYTDLNLLSKLARSV